MLVIVPNNFPLFFVLLLINKMVLRRTLTSTSQGKKSYLVGLHRNISESHEDMSWVCPKLSSPANPLPCLPKFILAQIEPSITPGQ